MHYEKPALTLGQQVQRWRDRGLEVPEAGRAQAYLTAIGYYRLSAYCLPFEQPTPAGQPRDHGFQPGTQFDDVLALYVFDRKLRLAVMEAVERIEVAVRTGWAHALAIRHGPHAHMNLASISSTNLKELAVVIPPEVERDEIANFLGHETARIDALVDEQLRLIELLKEKRQVVISRAVTKGLNPNVPMKDSGVAWIGHMPSHWAVKRLRFVAEINPSKSGVSHLASDTEVSFLPMEAIGEDGSLALDRVRALADVQAGYTFFRDEDVTIAKITPCFENGKGAAMRNLCNGIGFGTTELIVARPKATETSSTYLHWLFTSRPFRKAGEACMFGAGGQKRVPDDFVRDFAVGFPPLPEQHAIVAFLGHETAKLAALVEAANHAAAMLQERRAALISAAVTGKIDVRGNTPT